jgi:hypothetical protein
MFSGTPKSSMNYARIFVFLSLFTIILFGGCRRAAEPSDHKAATTNVLPEQYHYPEGGTIPAAETRFFKGSVGNTLGLQMKLVREGERLTGNYFYQKVGTRIDLRGTIDNGGTVTLEEFDSTGKQTGVFKGSWKPNEDGRIDIAGNWSKPNSEKQTAFALHEEPIEFSGGVEIIAKQIKENNKKLKYEIDAEYPQLTGSPDRNFEKFNQVVRSIVTKKVNDFRKEMAERIGEENPVDTDTGSDIGSGYTVALAKDDLISVQLDIGGYYAGAAHPNSYTETINFDLKNGKPLVLSDLFKPGAKYLQTISSYCIKDLKRQSKATDGMLDDDDWLQRGAGPDPNNYGSWVVTKKGLGINFDSYQVAPYAAGPQYVLVPYSALKDLIKPDGPLGQFR